MAGKLTKKQQSFINRVKAVQLRLSPSETVNDITVNQISTQLNVIHREAIGKAPGDVFSGDVVLFDRSDEELLALSVNLMPRQTGSGDPSLSNIRPITGYNAVSVYVRGFNQWDEEWEVGGLADGNPTTDASRIRSKNFMPCFGNMAYCKYSKNGNVINLFWYDINKMFISYATASSGMNCASPNNARFFKFCTTSAYGGTYKDDICINISDLSRNGEYEPYNPKSADYSISLSQPIYGGTINILTGEINATWAIIDSYAGETLPGEWLSDRDVYTPGGVPSTGAQVCYKLETPATSYTAGADVILLDGYNAIWSDNGEIEAIIL